MERMKERMSRFAQYMEHKQLNDNQVTVQCGLGVGVIGGARKGKSDLGAKTIKAILEKYQDLNRVWLLTGEGNMLNDDTPSQPTTPQPPQEPTHIIKYWVDVDTSAGYVDFPSNPDEREYKKIVLPDFKDCTDAVNLYGDSMYPLYKNGEVIVLKRWNESFIDYGNVYLIITKNGNRMVKYIRQGSDDAHVLCLSENKNFDSFEVLRDDILQLYIVKGSIKKNTL